MVGATAAPCVKGTKPIVSHNVLELVKYKMAGTHRDRETGTERERDRDRKRERDSNKTRENDRDRMTKTE